MVLLLYSCVTKCNGSSKCSLPQYWHIALKSVPTVHIGKCTDYCKFYNINGYSLSGPQKETKPLLACTHTTNLNVKYNYRVLQFKRPENVIYMHGRATASLARYGNITATTRQHSEMDKAIIQSTGAYVATVVDVLVL
jgi:hypothetical protein